MLDLMQEQYRLFLLAFRKHTFRRHLRDEILLTQYVWATMFDFVLYATYSANHCGHILYTQATKLTQNTPLSRARNRPVQIHYHQRLEYIKTIPLWQWVGLLYLCNYFYIRLNVSSLLNWHKTIQLLFGKSIS
jgi:hypothetical protein